MIFLCFVSTLVGRALGLTDCVAPLVLDSETNECVDLFGLANETVSNAAPEAEFVALWNDETTSAVLWPAIDDADSGGGGGNVKKRETTSRKNWNPIENGALMATAARWGF